MNIIPNEYYDYKTYDFLYKGLTDAEKDNIDTNEPIYNSMFQKWKTIINNLPKEAHEQYYLKQTQNDRNKWFEELNGLKN